MHLPASPPLLPLEHARGDLALLESPAAALLTSRQGRMPVGSEPWVRATMEAIDWLRGRGFALLAGVGVKTWELGLALASHEGVPVNVPVGVPEKAPPEVVAETLAAVAEDFRLDPTRSLLLPFPERSTRGSKRRRLAARDRFIVEAATLLLPLSLRPGGGLDSLAGEPGPAAKLDRRFEVEYAPRPYHALRPPEPDAVHRALAGFTWRHVAHWTRACPGPWPGERAIDYYLDLVRSGDVPPRSAFATLRRIAEERRIRASSWRMPGGRRMVSFSALHPAEMTGRMRWRRRYVRASFEPYGVAVNRDAIGDLGGREVLYGNAEERRALPPGEEPFFQSFSEAAYWPNEWEWRLAGDLSLDRLDPAAITLLVATPEERRVLEEEVSWRVFSLTP